MLASELTSAEVLVIDSVIITVDYINEDEVLGWDLLMINLSRINQLDVK